MIPTGEKPKHVESTLSTNTTQTKNDSRGRSAALERAYVHDVYENCDEPTGALRPSVSQFLSGLETGSLVCDVGCGNGRYLTANFPNIIPIGIDRCQRLSKVAKGKGGEVTICDNLELPFRDDSFDAVISLAVVHHFATTERRILALRELSRILRVGGRVVITVWALEQRHRRFESQDVLIPWQPPKNQSCSYCSDEDDDDEFLPPYHAYTEDSTNSSRSAGDGDSSSLSSSSPGESCYSFVRKAIQKLAGNRRHPWFLDSWNSKDTQKDNSLDFEDARDLPIELRRLEDFEDLVEPPIASAGLKSRSLGCILNNNNPPSARQIVRSRSSVPSLGGPTTSSHDFKNQENVASCPSSVNNSSTTNSCGTSLSRRPKLIKQKQSLCDEDYQLPDNPFYVLDSSNSSLENSKQSNSAESPPNSRLFLRKQSSLNEELMAANRLREKERVRKRIQKQTSLNEAFLYRSVFGRKLQVIKEGFATKIKSSTGSLERVTKIGLVKIIQNFTTATSQTTNENQPRKNGYNLRHGVNGCKTNQGNAHKPSCSIYSELPSSQCNCVNIAANVENEADPNRRHSKESGSDSSKDGSLQSDTSIESEDSFASVIFVPKSEGNNQQQQQKLFQQQGHNSSSSNSSNGKLPTSPLIMPCPPTPAHSPAAANSVVTSPPQAVASVEAVKNILSPRTADINSRHFTFDKDHILRQESILKQRRENILKQKSEEEAQKITRQTIMNMPPIPKFRKQPIKHCYPIIRRSSTQPNQPQAIQVPRYMSLELYNPATDDLDSDSNDEDSQSSEGSIDSVIDASKASDTCEKEDDIPLTSNKSGILEDIIEKNEECSPMDPSKHKEYVDFAEKLSAQLLKEMHENNNESRDNDDQHKIKTELTALREELRERRLMLANLSTLPSLQHSPNSSSTSSLSSQSKSYTIHEEDEEEDEECSSSSYPLNIYDHCKVSKFQYKWNQRYNLNPETAYLIQDDGDSSVRDEDEGDVILEENEEEEDEQDTVKNTVKSNSVDEVEKDSEEVVEPVERRESNSSLDSPSQSGGSTTHHRYYHVFREGELEALINHHVNNLHIVSSFYERASWCVVAEKVQVWTI
ncbi:KIAA1456 family protein [Megaselia abdita]